MPGYMAAPLHTCKALWWRMTIFVYCYAVIKAAIHYVQWAVPLLKFHSF